MLENIKLTSEIDRNVCFRITRDNDKGESAIYAHFATTPDKLYPLAKATGLGDPDEERVVLTAHWQATDAFLGGVQLFMCAEAPIVFADVMDAPSYGFESKVLDLVATGDIRVTDRR